MKRGQANTDPSLPYSQNLHTNTDSLFNISVGNKNERQDRHDRKQRLCL